MNPLNKHFHRAQARLRNQATVPVRGGQHARPAFSADDEDFFDIPTALRRKAARLAGRDPAGGSRMMDYGAKYAEAFKRASYEACGFRVQRDGDRVLTLNSAGDVVATEYGEAA